jgi:hypothetical protein
LFKKETNKTHNNKKSKNMKLFLLFQKQKTRERKEIKQSNRVEKGLRNTKKFTNSQYSTTKLHSLSKLRRNKTKIDKDILKLNFRLCVLRREETSSLLRKLTFTFETNFKTLCQ